MRASDTGAVQVIIDYRESRSAVVEAFRELPGVDLRFEQLAIGDYLVEGRCMFERKTVLDFARSIMDGRLFDQAQKLARLPNPAAIILEGRSVDLADTQIRREALQGALISLSLVFQLPVLRALDAKETARLIVYAGQQLRRYESQAVVRHGARPKRKRRMQLRILQGLPGIGPVRAEQLLDSFGNVQSVMAASAEALAEVEGIGAKTAAAIRDVLQESSVLYHPRLKPNLGLFAVVPRGHELEPHLPHSAGSAPKNGVDTPLAVSYLGRCLRP